MYCPENVSLRFQFGNLNFLSTCSPRYEHSYLARVGNNLTGAPEIWYKFIVTRVQPRHNINNLQFDPVDQY